MSFKKITVRFILFTCFLAVPFIGLAQQQRSGQPAREQRSRQTPDPSRTKVQPPPPPEPTDEQVKRAMEAATKPKGPSFYIQPIHDNPGNFTLLLTESAGRMVSGGPFRRIQIDLFEAILLEAKKFAQNDQGVGTTKPVITRFYDPQETAFIVDVAKLGMQSRFYVTLTTVTDRITVDAGSVKRGDPEAKAFLYDILTRIQAAKAEAQPPE